MASLTQLGCAPCQGPAFRAASAGPSGRRAAVVHAAGGEQQAAGVDRRQALMGLAAALVATQAPLPALAEGELT